MNDPHLSAEHETWLQKIRSNMVLKTTEELLSIWVYHDQTIWTEDAFEVVYRVLQERDAEIPNPGTDLELYPPFPHLESFEDELPLPDLSQEERILAALSHGSFLLSTLGIIVPIVIWVTHKDKSRFVGFQSLQALCLNLTFMGFGIALTLPYFGLFVFFLMRSRLAEFTDPSMDGPVLFLFAIFFFGYLVLGLYFGIYAILGVVKTFRGRPFRYPVLGKLIERWLIKVNKAAS